MPNLTVSIPGGRIGNFLAGAAVVSVIGGTAFAITSSDFTYSASQQAYYTINAMALAPSSNQAADFFSMIYPKSLSTGENGCYQTGVNFPQGAIVTSVTTWFSSGAASNISIYLVRQNLTSNGSTNLAYALVPDNSNTRKPVSLPVPVSLRTVDNSYFSYAYAVCLGAGTVFSGARISYRYSTAGD